MRCPEISVILNLSWLAMIRFINRIFAEDSVIVQADHAANNRRAAIGSKKCPGQTGPSSAVGRQWTASRSC